MQYVLFFLTLSFLPTAYAQLIGDDILNRSKVEISRDYLSGHIDLYSENSFRPAYDSLSTDTRLRYQHSLIFKNLKAYIGASLERDLYSQASLKFVEDSISPQVGILYQPFSWLNFWAEYRQRYQESKRDVKPEGESDPRVGLSGGFYHEQNTVFFEGYGEAVWIPRLSSGGVLSGYVRPFIRNQLTSFLNADLYMELYGYSSPSKDMGPTRTQARLGGRLKIFEGAWQSSLLVYQPYNLTSDLKNESQLEALLVIGGLF